MAIENEIVKFVAAMELDPQTTAEFTQGLKDADARANELRESIQKTTAELTKMRIEGKDNSDQFKALEASLKADSKALKDAQGKAEQYGKALGINQMSMKELSNHAKSLRSALYSMHKDADPKTWQKYQKELKATEARMKELKGGSEKTGGVLKSLGSKIAGGFAVGTLAVKALNGVVNLARKGFQDFTKATQTWGDRWTVATEAVKAGWQQFIANIGQGSNVIKGSITEAMNAAAEAAKLRDELFERNNSFQIMEADARVYMNTQQEIANDATKSAEERMEALNNIIAKEEELASTRKSIAQQEQTAALDVLQARTQLSENDLQTAIDAYEQNRDAFQLAQQYNDVLETRDNIYKAIAAGAAQSADSAEMFNSQLAACNATLGQTSPIVQKYAEILRQYNLANDDLVKAYVDATVKVKSADEQLTATQSAQAKKRSTLTKQMQSDAKAASDKAYNDRIAAATEAYNKEMLAIKTAYADGEMTQYQYQARSAASEEAYLNSKIAINKAYGKSTVELDTQLVDKRLAMQEKLRAALDDSDFSDWMVEQAQADEAAFDELFSDLYDDIEIDDSDMEAYLDHIADLANRAHDEMATKSGRIQLLTEQRDQELAFLNEQHDMQLISDEEYLERRKQLNDQCSKDIASITVESWENAASTASSFLGQMSSLVSSAKDAEEETLEAQMQAELAAAGDNADARAAIEEKYEAKKLDTEKKYADADMAINIAKTIADGALAGIKAFADLGPIAGAVMAGLIAATTVAEVAVIVAQRNAIKNQTASSSSSSSASTSNVQGFSEGGYTGNGERLEVAGVVHKGEYVVPQPEMRDPQVAAMVSTIESKRRSRTSKNALPGYAEGGYTDSDAQASQSDAILSGIYTLLQAWSASPVQAYVVLSQLEAQQDRQSRFKKITSLKQ